MIKGVNRQIIEVTETGNRYFERALLVVRADCRDQDWRHLHYEAHKLVREAGNCTFLRRNRRRTFLKRLLLALASGGGGLLAGFLLYGLH